MNNQDVRGIDIGYEQAGFWNYFNSLPSYALPMLLLVILALAYNYTSGRSKRSNRRPS